jgi:hypothetical protein
MAARIGSAASYSTLVRYLRRGPSQLLASRQYTFARSHPRGFAMARRFRCPVATLRPVPDPVPNEKCRVKNDRFAVLQRRGYMQPNHLFKSEFDWGEGFRNCR